LPDTGHSADIGLSTELPFRTYFARHAGYFARERIELVHHGVDRVFKLKNFAASIDRDLSREVAVCNARRHFGDVTNLVGEVTGHRIHRLRQILPDTGYALHIRLAAELSFRTYFAGHAGYFRGEPV